MRCEGPVGDLDFSYTLEPVGICNEIGWFVTLGIYTDGSAIMREG